MLLSTLLRRLIKFLFLSPSQPGAQQRHSFPIVSTRKIKIRTHTHTRRSMYLPKINTSEMSLRYSRSTNSSSLSTSSTKSKDSNPSSVLIQLCSHPDENYACRSMRTLLSSRYDYSPNATDDFGCNLLMYVVRYQRYRLLDFLLKNYFVDFDFHAKDQHGNTLLHYAVIYSGPDTEIMEKLIDKYRKFAIRVDERNNLGFTPLLLGRGEYFPHSFILSLFSGFLRSI